ncbi:MAG TPA: hypothetical protein VI078_12695, partial [bacterium]
MRARQPWLASRSGVAALLACGLLVLSAPVAAEPVDEAGGQLFASVATARRERFLHEVFEFTVSVYSRGLTMGREIALVNEETPGLQFGPFRDAGSGREEVNGRTYDVRRFVGRAETVAAGAYALRPTVRLTVVVPARGDGSPGRAEIRRTDLHPLASSLRVSALPEAGRPAAFGGAVGTFGFTASVRPTAVPAGEPVTLTMEIRGSGNIGPVAAPRVDGGAGFKAFEPRLLAKETGADGLSGRLAFEQTVVPLTAASTSLPAVRFAYFDPEQGGYREIVRGPFPLALRPSVRPAGAPPPEAPAA